MENILEQIAREESLALSASLLSISSKPFDPIREKLQEAIDAEGLIALELERLRQIPIESDYDAQTVDYYSDLVIWQLNHVSAVARRRMQYLDYLETSGKFKEEVEKCSKNTLHWFRQWAWTYDPRPDSPISDLPFEPFEFQSEFLNWLERQVFLYRRGALVEKSRDVGASWLLVGWNVKQWLYRPGYAALIGSRKEEYVDTRGDIGSLFEKIRYQIRLLPDWMLPKGFDPFNEKAMPFMKLVNPANKATLVGESSNPNFGRGGRYTAVFVDEFAAFPSGGTEAYTSLTQSSRCNIFISTPQGKQNKFAELKYNNSYPVYTIRWQTHPWKDERWYALQKATMNAADLAQEVDLDYEASLSGRIFGEWDERYHVITWSEFVKYFGAKAQTSQGLPRIPYDWHLGRAMDWGTTLEHPTACVWVARPKDGDPLSDCIFVYRELVRPLPGLEDPITPRRIGSHIYHLQAPYSEEHRFSISIMSHEASTEMDALQLDAAPGMALAFGKWRPDTTDGIGVLQNYLQFNPRKPHPFRPQLDGDNHKGSPKMFFVVDDDQGSLFQDGEGKYLVKPGKDDGGLKRLRAEIPAYHYPKTATGVEKNKPVALFNDAIDALRKLAANWFPPPAPKLASELLEEKIPVELRSDTLSALSDPDEAGLRWLSRTIFMREHGISKDDSEDSHWMDKLFAGAIDTGF